MRDKTSTSILGLGFASEAELGKFIEKFHEVKEATKNAMAKASTNGSSAVTPVTSANASPVTSRSSITQNDSFVSDIADPPLSATGSIVSLFINLIKQLFNSHQTASWLSHHSIAERQPRAHFDS